MRLDRHRTALSAFIVGTVLAGGNAVGVRVSNRELDPLWGAGLRFAPVVGTLLSIAGIGVISGVSGSETVPLLSLLAVLGSVLCFAQATVLVRHFPPVHPVTANAVGMATGAAILVALSLLLEESLLLPERGATWLALAYMVVLGSGPVFVLYLVVVRLWSASRAAYTFVLIPLV